MKLCLGVDYLMVKLYPFFAKGLLLPGYDLFRKTSRFKFARIIEKTQWFSCKEILRMQQKILELF